MRDDPRADRRNDRKDDRAIEPQVGPHVGAPGFLRRRRWLIAEAGGVVVLVGAALLLWPWRDAGPKQAVPSAAERLDRLEAQSLQCEAAPDDPIDAGATWPASANLEERRRFAMAHARRLMRDGAGSIAIEMLDGEARGNASLVDASWRSLRLNILRGIDRSSDAEAECRSWRQSLAEDDPERAWAESEWALHLAIDGRTEEAALVAGPWLGRSLSPVPAARFRLAEAIVRSENGDHGVASAALADARRSDATAPVRARIPCTSFAVIAADLASAAVLSGALRAAIEVSEQGLELTGAGDLRESLLRVHATASRAEAMRVLESIEAIAGAEPATVDGAGAEQRVAESRAQIERVNRHFMAAAASAMELAERLAIDTGGDTPSLRAAAMHLAAECWERAGRVDEAVAAWRDWLAWRPDSDPQRAEVLWRIAELQHGLARFTEAVEAYRMLLRSHPNSPQAARAPVAAARALRAMGEQDQAVEVLDGVLAGRGGIDPESPAFIAALVERGRLAHELGDAETAQRRFEELLRRDPHHAEAVEITLLLADSWRRRALESERAASSPAAPSAQAGARARSTEAWARASELFAAVVAWLDARDDAADPRYRDWSRLARVGLAASLEAMGRIDEAIIAWEEVDRRHPNGEVSLLALDRLRRLPGTDAASIRRRALLRLASMEDDGHVWLLPRDAWRQWFDEPPQLVASAPGGSS